MTFDWGAILGSIEKATPAIVKTVNLLKKKPKAAQAAVAQSFASQGVNVPTAPAGAGVSMPMLLALGAAGVLAVVLLRRR